jgi:hypothetical protein
VEETIHGGSGGRSRYEYVGTRRGPGGYGYPHVPASDSSRQAPLLIQQLDFNATGNMVRKVQYRYKTLPALTKLTRGYGLVYTPKANFCSTFLPEPFPQLTRFIPVKPFVMLSEFEYLAETKEYRYGTAPGQPPHLSISRTYYENPQHLQPTRTVQVLTPQDSLVTLTRYPTDYAAPAPPADEPSRALIELSSQHRLATVVEQVQWRVCNGQSQLVSAALQHFKAVPLRKTRGTSPPLILPARTYVLRTGAPLTPTDFVPSTITTGTFQQSSAYQEELRYERYDLQGNPTLVRVPQEAPNSLLWSDAGRRVVAEVKNAAPGYAAYTSFEPLSLGGWKYPGPAALEAHRQAGGRTGRWAYRLAASTPSVGLDSLPVATYLLSFWATGRPGLVLNGAPRPPPDQYRYRGDGARWLGLLSGSVERARAEQLVSEGATGPGAAPRRAPPAPGGGADDHLHLRSGGGPDLANRPHGPDRFLRVRWLGPLTARARRAGARAQRTGISARWSPKLILSPFSC